MNLLFKKFTILTMLIFTSSCFASSSHTLVRVNIPNYVPAPYLIQFNTAHSGTSISGSSCDSHSCSFIAAPHFFGDGTLNITVSTLDWKSYVQFTIYIPYPYYSLPRFGTLLSHKGQLTGINEDSEEMRTISSYTLKAW